MTLKTLGTNANNSLTAFVVGTNDVIAADVATLLTQLRGDPGGWGAPTGQLQTAAIAGTTRPRLNEAYVKQGKLVIPNRGIIQLKAGDYICWDATTGWPIVVSWDAAANGPYTHS